MRAASLLEVRNLSVTFATPGRRVDAVRGCSLSLNAGEVLALIGESGSGKSTLARTIAGIISPSSGSVVFRSQDLATLPRSQLRVERRRIQMVFQDPDASLNPVHRVSAILSEPLIIRGIVSRDAIRQRVATLLSLVQLDASLLDRRPRELSGGQKQRVAIARALAMEPEVLIADEPLASLDVSTAASIAQIFRNLRSELGIAMLFISHDLAAVRELADHVAVMYAGEIIESGPGTLLDRPAHPYTRLLLQATPATTRRLDLALVEQLDALPVMPYTTGACHYRARCTQRIDLCAFEPHLSPLAGATDRLARCHLARIDTATQE
jgi:oligopeptide/dipeptide ABC transporter ATP-binding protein